MSKPCYGAGLGAVLKVRHAPMLILNSECFAHKASIGLDAKFVNVARADVVTSKPKLKLPVLAATPKVAP